MYSIVAVAVAMCLLLPISVDATIDLIVNHRQAGEENNVRLECSTATATFYRMDSEGSMEQELSAETVTGYHRESGVAVKFVLNGTTEGLYFCRSNGNESPQKKLVGECFSVKWFAGFNPGVFFSRSISTPTADSFPTTSQCTLEIAVYSWLSVQYRSAP